MRCLIILALALLALEAVLAQDSYLLLSEQALCSDISSSEEEMACLKSCNTNENCQGDTKCCLSACGFSCKTPINVPKAGRCPWVPAHISPNSCEKKDSCSWDGQCTGVMKCCEDRCGMTCMTPILENLLQ